MGPHSWPNFFFSESLMIRSPSKIPSQLFCFWKKSPKKDFLQEVSWICRKPFTTASEPRLKMGGGDVCFFKNDVTWLSKEGNTSNAWIFSICLKNSKVSLPEGSVFCFGVGWYCEAPPLNATCDMAYRVPMVFSLHIFPGQWGTTEGLHIFWVYRTHPVHSLQRQVLRGICKTLPFLLFWSLFSAKHLGPV